MRPDIIVGIDPGKKGAIAVGVWGNVYSVDDLPINGKANMIDPKELDTLLISRISSARYNTPRNPVTVGFLLEEPIAIASGGTKTARTIGKGEGILFSAMVRLAGWDNIRTVRPNAWKGRVGVTAEKATSLNMARARWPHLADRLCLAKHDGRAEALLLAAYGHDNWDL